ncbi:MAG TPA: portal protein [Aliidongia sp.]|uniref:portal protein n=1 Tax=Aliidongia sp. TaxID=1914230 RepID=UPI002DDDA030|nr:portal protein [Aliidongia sp.]HEV2673387.1 portal protein [Aliidongia sp.]
MGDLASDTIREWERLDSERTTFKSHWQRVAQFLLPDRNDYIVQRTPGAKRMQWIYDATPVWALEQFAAGLHSLLTSPYLMWFGLKAEFDPLNDIDAVRLWLEQASTVMYAKFNGPRHNFASQSQELYRDLGSVGTGVMGVLESAKSGVLFSCRHLKECVIAENDEDRVDTLIRKWEWTAKQAYDQWDSQGVSSGPAVAKACADGEWGRKFWFMHRVRPRRDRDAGRGGEARHMAFESVYVSVQDQFEIAVGGYPEFPFLVPRFSKVTGETYGRGPGMTALPDIQMLNEMAKLVIKAAQKVIDPPLQLPDDGFMLPIKTVPGGLNYYRANSQGRIEPIETKGDTRLGLDMIQSLRQQIIRQFYVEFMMMPSDPSDPASAGKGVTATYVLQQRDEKMRLLSPMLARLQSEFLEPLINRTFAILWRQSKRVGFRPELGSPFPPPPPQLSGAALKTDYVSPIAIAQKSSQLDVIGRLMQTQAAILQMNPKAQVVIDSEAIMRITGRDLNAPVAALRSADDLAQERQAQQDAEQALQQHAAIANLAGAAKNGAGAVQSLASAGAIAQTGGAGAAPQQAAA